MESGCCSQLLRRSSFKAGGRRWPGLGKALDMSATTGCRCAIGLRWLRCYAIISLRLLLL
jgi:hypothetical protein